MGKLKCSILSRFFCAAAVPLIFSPLIQADEIDFEGLPAGTIMTELSKGKGITGNLNGKVLILGRNTIFGPDTNVAVVFDSNCPVVADPFSDCNEMDVDLGTPNEDFGGPGIGIGGEAGMPFQNDVALGNIAILEKFLTDSNGDDLVDDPDDADEVGFFDLDFSTVRKNKSNSTVVINAVSIMDIEFDEGESPAQIELMGPGIPTATISVLDLGNNGVGVIDDIGLAGVNRMIVNFKGSGGFVGVTFNETIERSCWITTGGFHNAGTQSGGKDFTFGGNVGPPPSGSWQVNDHNTGDKFHTNNVRITDCIEIPGTGPGQPGGKKGFVINQAFFECDAGRFNNEPGFTCTGFVVDRGEPSGKNANQKDEFYIMVRDSVGAVVMETQFELDGGNVQIHPPTGKPN